MPRRNPGIRWGTIFQDHSVQMAAIMLNWYPIGRLKHSHLLIPYYAHLLTGPGRLSPLWSQLLATTDFVDSMYGASLNMLQTLAEDAFNYSERLLMVGHNPGIMQMLVNVLSADQAAEIKGMSTGTLAVIEFPDHFKRQIRTGKLLHLVRYNDFSID